MKSKIHPKFYNAKVTCNCGNTFVTGSTLPEIQVDICSACHPFFTGEMKFVDTQGRVERFMAAVQKAKSKQKTSASDKEEEEKSNQPQKTLKEMMEEVASQTKAA